MRASFLLPFAFAFAFAASSASAQTVPAFPAGAEAVEARLLTQVGPGTRAWIRQEAGRQREQTFDASLAANISRGVGANSNLASGDIELLSFLVLMEAARAAQEDLRAVMAGVKAINDAKGALRQTPARPNPAPAIGSATANLRVPPPPTAMQVRPAPVMAVRPAVTPAPLSRAELDTRIAAARNNLDSLNEMGEMESVRLQMTMDRVAKFMQTLSNIQKKISDTSAGITQNLK